jgi:hypothetical protein
MAVIPGFFPAGLKSSGLKQGFSTTSIIAWLYQKFFDGHRKPLFHPSA